MFNVRSGSEEATYSCHESFVSHVECNRAGDLLLTSTSWGHLMSALWSLGTFFDMKIPLDHEDYVEFSKLQDKIVGTQNESATVRANVYISVNSIYLKNDAPIFLLIAKINVLFTDIRYSNR